MAVASQTCSMATGSISKSRQSMAAIPCALSEVQEALVSHTAEELAFLAVAPAPTLLNHARLVVFASWGDRILRGCAK